MLLLPEYSHIKSAILPAQTCNPKVLLTSLLIHLQLLSLTLSYPLIPIYLYTYPPSAADIAMPVKTFIIGVEEEMLCNSRAGSNLPNFPNNDAGHKSFTIAAVESYKEIRKDKMCTDFEKGSHPGHDVKPENMKKWIAALDPAIGHPNLDSNNSYEARTYISTLCGVTISIRLTTTQIPLKLSLRK